MKKNRILNFVIIMTILMCSIGSVSTVYADPAPPLTDFQIIGFSWPDLYNQGGYYYDASDASAVSVPSTTAYIITYQMGYGNTYISGSMANEVERFPIQGYDSLGRIVVIGWYKVLSVSNLSNGSNTISPYCMGTVFPYRTISDSITLDIQPNLSAAPNVSIQSQNEAIKNTLDNLKNVNK